MKKDQNKKKSKGQLRSNAREQSQKGESTYFNPYASYPSAKPRTSSTYDSPYQSAHHIERSKQYQTKNTSGSLPLRKSKQPAKKNTLYTRNSLSESRGMNNVYSEELPPEIRRQEIKRRNQLSKAQIRRNKKRKQRQFILSTALLMCLTTLTVWGGIKLKDFFTKPTVSYQIVKTGIVDTSKSLEGVFLRTEEVVYGQQAGNVQYIVSEGEKVKKDGMVYVLVDEKKLTEITKEQQTLDKKVYNVAENRKEISSYQDQIYDLDQTVESKLMDYFDNRYEGSTQYVYNLRTQLDQNITQRTSIYTDGNQENTKQMAELRTQIEKNINQYQVGKLAPKAGIVSYKMDGAETKDVAASIKNMNYNTYNDIIKSSEVTSLYQSYIKKDAPVYKLVLNNKWYVMSYVDAKEEESFIQGNSYSLDFSGVVNSKVTFKLVSKKVESERYVQLLFETDDQVNDFLGLRYAKFTIGNKNVSGLKIPVQAIVEQNMLKIPSSFCVEKNGQVGVYRQIDKATEFVPITVQSQTDDTNSILQDLTNNTTVQVNNILVNSQTGKTYQVTKIETVKGVYVINGKVAEFKPIEIDVISGEYAIVKYSTKSQLKEMDKIISNPKSVKNDQLLQDMNVQNE